MNMVAIILFTILFVVLTSSILFGTIVLYEINKSKKWTEIYKGNSRSEL